ncbi:MAG: FAR7a/AIG1-like family protein [Marmoricola sp.]|jgi:hypothetical protein|nr:FAR7a/AIG1-like family protein [Marmoricola sp.]
MTEHTAARQPLLTGYRMVVALVTFAAVVTEIATLAERGSFKAANFFSYFTIEANSFAVVVLILSALSPRPGRAVVMLRGASTLYMAVTGIAFSVLLSGIKDAEFTAVPWDNVVLHYLTPIAVVLDWFIDLPSVRIAYRDALVWLAVPIAYAAYSLIRGPIVHWYPYPFLDPGQHSAAEIAITIAALVVLAAALIWIVIRFTGREVRR